MGSENTITVDARIIAASSHDLVLEVAARRFREDLYYRLGVITLRVPALRARATSCLWRRECSRAPPSETIVAVCVFLPKHRRRCCAIDGPEMSASCATSSSAPRFMPLRRGDA